ncbi:metallophosphoesterase [Pseudomonas sp. sp1636]|uniref:metallophosphoesterase n=1 Tax=Pseudomonas sp. sp1636 TaxID=3036707 RepID=UPI0025A56A12|nr:metallophosphoesterase [Pseudomonas sp. sp1636]MDM8347689.1 metallophosphoesterase [Pseudomonas sp. sp1636]
MKLHILSDLHNEFDEYVPSPAASEADVVILAGDIDIGLKGIEWADKVFNCPVIYVPGNHEFYRHHLEHMLDDMKKLNSDKVKVLDMGELVLGDVRFLGATAWTDFASTGDSALAALFAQQMLNDFNLIFSDNYRNIRPADLIKICANAKSWLRSKINEEFCGKTVVITHHAPVMQSLEHSPHARSHLEAAFANDWKDLVTGDLVDLWIHGHTHISADYDANGTRVISNQRGYPGETTGFEPDLIIEP